MSSVNVVKRKLIEARLSPEDFTAGQWSAIVNAAYACFTSGHVLGFKQALDNDKEVYQ